MADVLERAAIPTESADVARVPQNTVDLDADDARQMLDLLDALEEQDDVQNVIANFNISTN